MRRSLLNKIRSYSALAGVVALAVPVDDAEGQIIYTNVEPDTSVVFGNDIKLDLNGDGIMDFNVQQSFTTTGSTTYRSYFFYNRFQPLSSKNKLQYKGSSSWNATPLQVNDTISAAQSSWATSSVQFPSFTGDGYVGMKIAVGGNDYYGWARFSVKPGARDTLVIHDYAYNSQPGQFILAGQTGCTAGQTALVSVNNDTLIAQGQGSLKWSRQAQWLPAYDDSLKLYHPLQGTYVATFIDTTGCHINSTPFEYRRCDSIYADIRRTDTGSTVICNYAQVNLAYNYSPAGLYFQWQKNGANISGANNNTYYYAITDTTAYRLIVSYYGCVKTSNTIQFNIYPLPPPTVKQRHDSLVCLGPFITYQWLFKGSIVPGETNWYYYRPKYSNNITVRATDSLGCTLTTYFLSSFDSCYYLNATVVADDYSICKGWQHTRLHAIKDTAWHYKWNGGSPTDSSDFTVSKPGEYYLVIFDDHGCSKYSGPIEIIGINGPSAEVGVKGDTLFSKAGVNVTFQWQRDLFDITGATNRNYLPTQPGSYTVVVTNVEGCNTQSSAIFISGTEELAEAGPCTLLQNGHQLTIGISQPLQGGTLTIYNLLGQVVFSKPITQPTEVFTWAGGSAMLQVVIKKGDKHWVEKVLLP